MFAFRLQDVFHAPPAGAAGDGSTSAGGSYAATPLMRLWSQRTVLLVMISLSAEAGLSVGSVEKRQKHRFLLVQKRVRFEHADLA